MALQIRRGPTADRVTKTFVEGEIIYDTDLKEVFIGDGTSLGGKTVSTYTDSQSKDAAALTLTHNVGHSNIAFAYDNASKRVTATVTLDGTYNDLVQDTTPELGGNLLLNGKDIALSSGPVIINGTTGNLTGNLTGNVTGNVSGNAGTVTNGVYTTSTLNIGQTSVPLNRASGVQTLTGVSITGNAATVTNGIYNTGNQAIAGELSATAFRGNVYGSVYKADGIALLVNAPTNSINAASVTTVDLTVSGTLVVNGTTTTINSTTLEIADKNITLAKGAATALAADGAGISIDGANATILYVQSTDRIVINKAISSSNGFVGNVTGNLTGNADTVTNGVYTSGDQTIAGTKTFSSPILGNLQGNIATDSLSASTTTINVTSPIVSTESINASSVNASNVAASVISSSTVDSFTVSLNFLDTVTPNASIAIRPQTEFLSTTVFNQKTSFLSPETYFFEKFNFRQYLIPDDDQNFVSTAEITHQGINLATPVMFGHYTSTQRDALVSKVTINSIGWSAGTVTINFNILPKAPFVVGSTILVVGVSPAGYNGNYTVTACTNKSVSYVVSNPGAATGTIGVYNVVPGASLPLSSGGSGYAVNDTVSVGVGEDPATLRVATIGAGGVVLTLEVTDQGSDILAGTYTTSTLTGSGSGLFVDVLTSNVTGGVQAGTVIYNISDNKFQGFANGTWVDFH
jgi:hypothetical protein